jgi:hypothetical protein
LDAADTGKTNEGLGDLLGCTAVSDQATQHGAETEDDDKGTYDIADPFLDSIADPVDVEAGSKAQGHADHDERDEGVELHPKNEQYQAKDAQERKQ